MYMHSVYTVVMYLLFSIAGEHEDGDQGLQPAHLPTPFLQKDGSSGTDTGIVNWTYFHCVPVVVPRDNAVQYREE